MTDKRFAANLKWLFTTLPLAERFDAAAAAGFAAVEVPDPYALSTSEFGRLLAESGLQPVLLNTPAGPAGSPTQFGAACLPDHVDEFRAGVERGLTCATAVGCPLLHVVGGRLPAGPDAPPQERRRAFATYVANLAWAADRADGSGVRLVLEMQNQRSSPGFVLRSQAEAAAAAQAVGGHVGLLFDFFHTQVAEGDVTESFLRHNDLIAHIQIGDAPTRSEPGTGELHWPFVFQRIDDAGYAGWLGCEFTPAGDSAGVLGRLRELV